MFRFECQSGSSGAIREPTGETGVAVFRFMTHRFSLYPNNLMLRFPITTEQASSPLRRYPLSSHPAINTRFPHPSKVLHAC